jgi:hypothetical protein
MTNPDPTLPISATNINRQTLKTSFINNDKYVYTGKSDYGTDSVDLEKGDYIINTMIDYTEEFPYVFFKLSVVEFGYPVLIGDDFIISSYDFTDPQDNAEYTNKLRITLPVIGSEQAVIPESGLWEIGLYLHRTEQRQSLSKALKPKGKFPEADF